MLKSGSIAASAAALSSPVWSAPLTPEVKGRGVFHVFGFHWKDGSTQEDIQRATTEILAFQGVIPGLLQTHVGPNSALNGKQYTFGGVMQFKDRNALAAYVKHPAHQALLKWLMPLIDAVEIDIAE